MLDIVAAHDDELTLGADVMRVDHAEALLAAARGTRANPVAAQGAIDDRDQGEPQKNQDGGYEVAGPPRLVRQKCAHGTHDVQQPYRARQRRICQNNMGSRPAGEKVNAWLTIVCAYGRRRPGPAIVLPGGPPHPLANRRAPVDFRQVAEFSPPKKTVVHERDPDHRHRPQ
ncbi:MAG: hypothetical protein H6872_08720 [Methylobacteriaceae bacterium]|nr:hypothetical protein [Methylobacteriaceae bacterium]